MASIQKFLENECGNLYSNIVYYIDDTTRKKIPTNEKNNRSLEEIRKQKTKPNFPTHKKYKKNTEGNWIRENHFFFPFSSIICVKSKKKTRIS